MKKHVEDGQLIEAEYDKKWDRYINSVINDIAEMSLLFNYKKRRKYGSKRRANAAAGR